MVALVSIFNGRQVKSDDSLPTAFSSIFGWVLIEPLLSDAISHIHSVPVSLTTSIEIHMDKFWFVEEPEAAPSSFTDDGWSENQFRAKHKLLPSSPYVVQLPTRSPLADINFLGSHAVAVKRFESLERKLSSNNDLRKAYCEFVSEYYYLLSLSLSPPLP